MTRFIGSSNARSSHLLYLRDYLPYKNRWSPLQGDEYNYAYYTAKKLTEIPGRNI